MTVIGYVTRLPGWARHTAPRSLGGRAGCQSSCEDNRAVSGRKLRIWLLGARPGLTRTLSGVEIQIILLHRARELSWQIGKRYCDFKTLESTSCDLLSQNDIKKTVLDYTAGLGACQTGWPERAGPGGQRLPAEEPRTLS